MTFNAVIRDEWVEVYCLSIKNKLKIRINHPGYPADSNCSFPSDIRVVGKRWKVRSSGIKLIPPTYENKIIKKKGYYRIDKNKLESKVGYFPGDESIENFINLKIYGDQGDCDVCYERQKNVVFIPCSHFACCDICANNPMITKCPICRSVFREIINRDQID
jgi:hypothetical protein